MLRVPIEKIARVGSCLVLAFGLSSAHAALITEWDFNGQWWRGGSFQPSQGEGELRAVGRVTGSFVSGFGSSDPVRGLRDRALRVENFAPQGRADRQTGAEFAVSTVGYTDIFLSYDIRHDDRSSRYEQVQYSTDGKNFFDVGGLFDGADVGSGQWSRRTVDLSSIAGVENNSLFAFRIVSAFAPGQDRYAATRPSVGQRWTGWFDHHGPDRGRRGYDDDAAWTLDKVSIGGIPDPVPVPAALPLFATGLLAFGHVLVRRRRG